MRKNMDFITTLSNTEGICRSCYTLCCFTVPTIYLPIIAVLLVTYDELLRLHLASLFSFAKVLRRGNARCRYAGLLANGLVDLTTTFRNFHHVLIGYFTNSSAIYLSYSSVSTVSWLHVKFRF